MRRLEAPPTRRAFIHVASLVVLSATTILLATAALAQAPADRAATAPPPLSAVVDAARALSTVSVTDGAVRDDAAVALVVVPACAVLSPNVTAAGVRCPAPARGDAVVTDAFLSGSCVTLVLAQAKVGWHNFSRLAVGLAAPGALDGVAVRVLSTQRHQRVAHEGSAAILACHPALAAAAVADVSLEMELPPGGGRAAATLRASRAPLPPPGPPAPAALCTMVKGTAPAHLALWLDFHAAAGFGRAFVFVNEPLADFWARRGAAALLGPRLRDRTLALVDWSRYPKRHPACGGCHLAQTTAANACHRRFRSWATAFAFIDVDEFVLVPPGAPARSLLAPPSPSPQPTDRAPRRAAAPAPFAACVLLPCTWGVAPALLPVDLRGLLAANVTVAGPQLDVAGVPVALRRHKLFADAAELDVVAVHGPAEARWGDGAAAPPPRCHTLPPHGADGELRGFIHLISPSLVSARTSALSNRDPAAIAADVRGRPGAHITAALRDVVYTARRAPAAAP